jgi:hypothetical protein
MNVQVDRFQLEGCRCRLKFDPKELQELLYEKITNKVRKKSKQFSRGEGELQITGRFTEIDEGNYALHFMLAFLGKARLACHVRVLLDGQPIIDEPLKASATCAAFTPGRGQLKTDVQVIADQVVKKTIKALKA